MMKAERVLGILLALYFLLAPAVILIQDVANNTINVVKLGISLIVMPIAFAVLMYLLNYQKNREMSSNKIINHILADGYKVQAKFLGIYTHFEGGEWHSLVICSWLNPEDYKNYIFSRALEYNLHADIKDKIEQSGVTTFDVYISNKNIKKYWIDLKPVESWKE